MAECSPSGQNHSHPRLQFNLLIAQNGKKGRVEKSPPLSEILLGWNFCESQPDIDPAGFVVVVRYSVDGEAKY